jgi:trans-2,3-dihydro-3-hydroxyanthranilate isomerase
MAGPIFSIVDVFAEAKYAGNQLAVVRPAGGLEAGDMQRIAREINFSETAFVLSDRPRRGGFDVRIFTPARELPFAGHPTLGTAFVIQQDLIRKPVPEVILNLKVGPIPVAFSYRGRRPDVLWMKQIRPQFGFTLEPSRVAPILGLRADDLDSRFPIEEVSTGIPFIIVPVRTLQAVKKSALRTDKLAGLPPEGKAFLLFSPQVYRPGNDLNARVFAYGYGVGEDPATGSANGCLAGYLVRHRYFGGPRIDIRVEQGYEIGRPSLLLLRAAGKRSAIEVLVGGRVIPVARGRLL